MVQVSMTRRLRFRDPRSLNLAFCLVVALGMAPGSRLHAAVISAPTVDAERVSFSFSFSTTSNTLYSVQQTEHVMSHATWRSVAHLVGSGRPAEYLAPIESGAWFFRVRQTALRSLELLPNSPVLSDGAISLPDAEIGAAYQLRISPELSGVPPYDLSIHGPSPDGWALVVSSNRTENASVMVASSATQPPAGPRSFQVSAIDAQNEVRLITYHFRVIEPAPMIAATTLVLKAGEPVDLQLAAGGGTGSLAWSLAGGALPEGLELSSEGRLRGTPTAAAAEFREDGRHAVVVRVTDHFIDRLSGASAPRTAEVELGILVRLSYALNIRATRDNGPSLRASCVLCHGPGFKPDLDSISATVLMNVTSGSGAECGTTRPYVAPGDASDSLVYEKLLARSPCGDRMPQGGPYLSTVQLARLARWIRELTPSDTD